MYRLAACFIILPLLISSCANPRVVGKSEIARDKIRALNIQGNETIYSKSLSCYGKQLAYLTKIDDIHYDDNVFLINDIKDKTKKIYDGETGISDMVMTAMLRLNYFDVYDYEDGEIEKSKINFLHPRYPYTKTMDPEYRKSLKSSYNQVSTALTQMPIGYLKPADFTISGALTQYDDIKSRDIGLDIHYIGYKNTVNLVDVGLDLRLVYAPEGIVTLEPTKKGYRKSNFVSLKNRLIVGSDNFGNYFRTIDNRKYGISLDHSSGDPKYQAVRETVELGVLELISNLTKVDWRTFCSVDQVHKDDEGVL